MNIRAWHVISTLVTILIMVLGFMYYIYFPPKNPQNTAPKSVQTATVNTAHTSTQK